MKKGSCSQRPPSLEQLSTELEREKYRHRFGCMLRSTLFTLIVAAAAAVLIATIWMPVLRICGSSMSPTVNEGDIVLAIKSSRPAYGDLTAFYTGNKILVKRCVAVPGQWVNIDETGNVFVDGEMLEEPYLTEKALGECDVSMPCQVPEGHYFCIGDHRSTSVDSRHSSVGFVEEQQLVGKIVFRVWPLKDFGPLG